MKKYDILAKIRLFQFSGYFKLVFAVPLVITTLLSSAVFAQKEKTITAMPAETPIKPDGFLNEPSWKNCEPINDFTQRELVEGARPTEKTEVRVLYDEKNLYIGIVCYDSEPDKIVHNELVWDGDLKSDDSFLMVLDTFNDQRTGYYFRINPNGARVDALIKSMKDINEDWDGIWDVAARITDRGWQAEMVIPFLSLRFPKSETQLWGINFLRIIRRKNEEVLWTSWERDDGPLQLSRAGKLLGLMSIRRGKQVEITPYILGGVEKEIYKDMDDTFKYGFGLKYPLTSDLTVDFTVKTDFAQVESDKERINLTRFSLQYPEKRDFFLEGAEIFDFTQGGTKMYYSRRIGITPDPDRQEVPILSGIKLSGKTGAYRIGLMNMQTEKKTVTTAEGTKNYYPPTNYTVIRVKRDILKQSYIGFIGTMVNRTEKPDNPLTDIDRIDRFMNKRENHMFGFDFAYNTNTFMKNKNFIVQGYFAASKTPGLSGDGIAGRLWITYPNDTVDAFILYHGIDKNFNPEIGFVSRPGIQHLMAVLKYTPRVKIPYVKKLLFEPYEFTYMTDTRTKLLTRKLEIIPFGILFESDDSLEFKIHNHFDYFDYDFKIFRDTFIYKGSYEYWHYMLEYNSVKSRPVAIDLLAVWGDYYNGTRNRFSASCTFKLNKFFSVTPDMAYSDITIGNDSFETKEASARFTTNLSTRLTSTTFVQWNNDTNQANLNFRIHYIPKIGSDVYIVYNQLWDEEDDFRTLSNTGMLKVDYLFRF